MEGRNVLVMAELIQLQDLARKLSNHLDPCQIEFCRAIAEEITYSVEKAICQAKSEAETLFSQNRALDAFELDLLLNDNELKTPKKRKMLPKWTSQVSSSPGAAEVPPEDGHSWRKYGQKDILGARFPRAYYRCTHRKTQGCLAMKQVQRSDENHSVFDITYRGTHTCSAVLQQNAQRSGLHYPYQGLLDQQNSWQIQFDFESGLKMKTESSDSSENPDPTSSFSFPPTPTQGMKNAADLFSSSQNYECDYVGSLSSTLMSPTNSGTNCLLWSPCQMSSHGEMDHDITFDPSIFFV